MKEASTYQESPISKSKWSSVVKSKVREYWSSHIHTMSQMYSSLQFLNSKSIYKGNIHPILKHKYYLALNIDRISIKFRIVTGTYVLQTKRIKFYRDESNPTCLLCRNAEETIQHFILDCQKLESERTKILMEISATWQNIQNQTVIANSKFFGLWFFSKKIFRFPMLLKKILILVEDFVI